MRPLTRRDYSERILRVLVFIQEHLDEPLGLETLAKVAAFSPFHFHRLFRALVGESVKEHVRRLRLERAARFLKGSRRPVTVLALEAGFESHEAFTRAFRAAFGRSPSAYRTSTARQQRVVRDGRVHLVEREEVPEFAPLRDPAELEPRVASREPTPVLFIRHVGSYEKVPSEIFDRLAQAVGDARAPFIGIAHDDPTVTQPERQRFDACIPASRDVAASGDIGWQVLPGGRFAVANHVGSSFSVAETYIWLAGEWMAAQKLQAAKRPALEVYRGHPFRTPDAQMVTEVWLPLEPS